ncbi:MAG: hypothetical protein HZA46_00195 [Planctomycetales bacterium]|nr:hypothetical protein [Planctomycetales bacterium]
MLRCIARFVPLCLLVVTVGSCPCHAADLSDIAIEAFAGEPFGVGKMTVRFDANKPARVTTGQEFWLVNDDQRTFFPTFETSHLRLSGEPAKGVVDQVTVYFLIRGDAALKVTLDVSDSHHAEVTPRRDPAAYKKLLDQWWQRYTTTARRLAADDRYSPQVENYLVAMLSRRLNLQAPNIPRSWSGREDVDSIFGTLLGAESVRLAMQKETFLQTTSADEVANQPFPTPAAPPQIEIPTVPGDVPIEQIAQHVPAECFYVRCGSYRNFRWMRTTFEQWGGDLRNLTAVRGLDYEISDHVQRQLALQETALAKLLGDTVIRDMALIGTDTFVREGAAIGVLFQARSDLVLSTAIQAQRQAALAASPTATQQTVEIGGRKVSLLSTPDNAVRSFYVSDGDFHLVTTSKTIVQRFLEAGAGKDSLGDLKEFRYARTLMPLSRNDTLFVYLSDPFFRSLVGPHYRVEMTRRMRAEAEIELVELARLAALAEKRPADTIEALIAGGFLTDRFGKRPDGSRTVRDDDQIVDSLRGARRSFRPVPDVEITGLTPSEVKAYEQFAQMYARQWQRMDPVIVGLRRQVSPNDDDTPDRERIVMDVHISPYAQQHYGWFAGFLSPPDKTRVAPVPGNLIEGDLLLGGRAGPSPSRLFAGVRDFAPAFALHDGEIVGDRHALESRTPYYVGETPQKGIVTQFLLGNKTMADGEYVSTSGAFGTRWFRAFGDFVTVSNNKMVLEAVTPHLKLEDAVRPAQLRLRVGDLSASQWSHVLMAQGYVRSRKTSAGNVHFFHSLMRDLHVDATDCLAAAERVLAAKPTCPLGGKYALKEFGPGPVRWHSPTWANEYFAAETGVPENYRFPLLDWLRGLDLEFSIDRTTLSTHIELELQPKESGD